MSIDTIVLKNKKHIHTKHNAYAKVGHTKHCSKKEGKLNKKLPAYKFIEDLLVCSVLIIANAKEKWKQNSNSRQGPTDFKPFIRISYCS